MNEMKRINLRVFREKAKLYRRKLRRFLTHIEKDPPPGINKVTIAVETDVWKEIDCLSCANCCKTMTPTFTPADVRRISAHFGQTPSEFKEKWLYKERGSGDWMNKKEPCQFLNLKDNKCSIYEIRPADCAGFPHLTKNINGYAHVHKQNVEYCPATLLMVERMKAFFERR